MNKKLTIEEQNLIKDILKIIGRDDEMDKQFARGCGMTQDKFEMMADGIFIKLGNGRLTVES